MAPQKSLKRRLAMGRESVIPPARIGPFPEPSDLHSGQFPGNRLVAESGLSAARNRVCREGVKVT